MGAYICVCVCMFVYFLCVYMFVYVCMYVCMYVLGDRWGCGGTPWELMMRDVSQASGRG